MRTPTKKTTPTPDVPPVLEIFLTNDHRGRWRGELHDGSLALAVNGLRPEGVVAELVQLYQDRPLNQSGLCLGGRTDW